jgi:HEPN domain-containing protein
MSQEGAHHRAGLWLAQAHLRSHSLTNLLRELGAEPAERWQRQARVLVKLYAPTRYPDALGDDLPSAVFGPEDPAVWWGPSKEVRR